MSTLPDAAGRLGPHGGRYVPETLVATLEQRLAHSWAVPGSTPSAQSRQHGFEDDDDARAFRGDALAPRLVAAVVVALAAEDGDVQARCLEVRHTDHVAVVGQVALRRRRVEGVIDQQAAGEDPVTL